MKLSVVATLYQSANTLIEFHRRASAAARAYAGDHYEIILVNDGSPDDSLTIARSLLAIDAHLSIVDLSRNFGHHPAMLTGLAHAKGDLVFLIDSDLEEEPEWLAKFAEQLQRESCDVVYGQQAVRKGDLYEKVSGGWFWPIIRLMSGLDIPENITTARLMTRRYVDALLQHKEREMFIAGLWYITGFTQCPVLVTKHALSPSTYTFRKKMAIVLNSITSFSNAPLLLIFYLGLVISFLALCFSGYLVVNRLFFAETISGWTSVMVSIWLLGGLIISLLGVIGLYIAKIFAEVKQRPITLVRQVYDCKHQ